MKTPSVIAPALVALALFFGLLSGGAALAHGGEDHGDEGHDTAPAPAPVALKTGREHPEAAAGHLADAASELRGEAASENYELVLRAASRLEAATPQELTVLLSDFETNRPIQGARVDLELTGPGTVSASAVSASEPGIYLASLRFPRAGSYQVVASITEGDRADLLPLDDLVVHGPGAGQAGTRPGWSGAAVVGATAAGLVLVAGVFLGIRRRMRRTAVLLALAMPLAGQPAWAHAGHDDEETVGSAPPPPGQAIRIPKESQFLLGIRTLPAREREMRQHVVLLGRLEAPPHQVAQLHAPVPGRIASQAIAQLGDRVRKGQVLAVIEQVLSTSEQIQLASEKLKLDTERARLEADVAQAEQDVGKAQADLARARRLRDLVPQKAILEAEIALRKAQEALRGLKARRALFEKMRPPEIGQARRFPIVAPFGGVITESHATFGEQVDPGKPLFHLVDTSTLWAVAEVFERDVSRVAEARGAKVRLDAMPGKAFPARLASFGTIVDERTRTLQARFAIPNYLGRLKPGMFARVEVDLGGSRRSLAVPREAVTRLGDDPVVFVHTTAEGFVARPIRLGPEDGAWIVVIEGLAPGYRVVTEGVFQLKTAAEKGTARK